MSVNMSKKSNHFSKIPTIDIKCAICLETLSSCPEDCNIEIQSQFYKVCCKILKLESHVLEFNFKSPKSHNNQTIQFCDKCLTILKDLNTLFTTLTFIENSIRKIEMDIKVKILQCYKKETPEVLKVNDEVNQRYVKDRQHFRSLAVKDFLPIIRLEKIKNTQQNSQLPKLLPEAYSSDDVFHNEELITKTEPNDEPNIDIVKQDNFSDDDYAEDVTTEGLFPEDGRAFLFSDPKVDSSGNAEKDIHTLERDTSDIANNELPTNSMQQFNGSAASTQRTNRSTSKSNATESNLVDIAKRSEDDDFSPSELECNDTEDSDLDYKPRRLTRARGKPSFNRVKIKQLLTTKKIVRKSKHKSQASVKVKSEVLDRIERTFQLSRHVPVEVKIAEGKWSLGSIDYQYNETANCYECSLCQMTRITQPEIRNHIQHRHKGEVSGQWTYAGVPYSVNKETGKSQCSVCEKYFSDRVFIARHIRKFHTDQAVISEKVVVFGRKAKKPPPAETKISEGKWSYRSIEYHVDETTNRYVCSVCQRTSKSQPDLRKHIKTVHAVDDNTNWSYGGVPFSLVKESGKFLCSVCKKLTSDRNTIMRHIRKFHRDMCTNLKKKVYYDDIVDAIGPHEYRPVVVENGKWLFREVEITEHSDNSFRCGACELINGSLYATALHIAAVHDEKTKLANECEICKKRFGHRYSLKTHLRSHLGKPFKCERCGAGFNHKGALNRHINRVHEQKRPYVCEYCGKAVCDSKDLQAHVRTHTKEKPFACEFPGCGKLFSVKNAIRRHMVKTHTGNN